MSDSPQMSISLARSFLFVPGDRPERYDKACSSGADVVVVDLEDAVAPLNRAMARFSLQTWLHRNAGVAVRINAAGTEDHQSDLALVKARPGIRAVVVAKAEEPTDLARITADTQLPVIALIETALGLLKAPQIAATEGVARLAFGHADFALDLEVEPTQTALLHARSGLVLASRAAKLPNPVDGVTLALNDPESLLRDIRHAREVGMTGKLLIHPAQVAPTHAAYLPNAEDVAWAQRVMNAVKERGAGAIRVDGELVDAPVLQRAERLLAQHDR